MGETRRSSSPAPAHRPNTSGARLEEPCPRRSCCCRPCRRCQLREAAPAACPATPQSSPASVNTLCGVAMTSASPLWPPVMGAYLSAASHRTGQDRVRSLGVHGRGDMYVRRQQQSPRHSPLSLSDPPHPPPFQRNKAPLACPPSPVVQEVAVHHVLVLGRHRVVHDCRQPAKRGAAGHSRLDPASRGGYV